MEFNAHRDEIYDWLRRCLIGPGAGAGSGPNLIKPLDRYQTGILFPIVKGEDGLDPAAEIIEDDEDAAEDGDKDGSGPTATSVSQPRRRFVPPSSVGLSFFVAGEDIRIQLNPPGGWLQTARCEGRSGALRPVGQHRARRRRLEGGQPGRPQR